jgi:hypothetical protein
VNFSINYISGGGNGGERKRPPKGERGWGDRYRRPTILCVLIEKKGKML